jgi:serine/threonine-protein phosphatase 2B regulatory subunit
MGNQLVAKEEDQNYSFTKQELKSLYRSFLNLDKDKSGNLEANEFLDMPQLMDNPIVKRVIAVFDQNKDGKISFYEFVLGLSVLADFSNKEEKIKFAFQIYDFNNDGFISNGDLFYTLKLLTGRNLSDVQIQQVVDRTMIKADKDCDGKVCYEEFVEFVQGMKVDELLSMNFFDC